MGLAIGIFVITAGCALAFALCMGSAARSLWRRRLSRRPTQKKLLTALFWVLAAGSAVVALLCVWAAWSCFQADIFG